MKLKKNISQLLSIGILLNNLSFYSNASMSNTEIPNRYEILEGEYITIDDSTEGELVEIEIFGNTIQDKNNLSDIQSVGDLYVDKAGNPILDSQGREQYKVDIISNNKNILSDFIDYSYTDIYTDYGWNVIFKQSLDLNNGIYRLSQDNAGNNLQANVNILTPSNKPYSVATKKPIMSKGNEYTISFKYSITDNNRGLALKLLNLNGEEIYYKIITNSVGEGNFSTTFIPSDDIYFFGLHLGYGGAWIFNLEISELMIELNNKKTEFVKPEYQMSTILLPTQLQKVGDIADRLYWDNEKGRYIIEKNIHSFITNSDSDVVANWGNIINTIGIDNTGKEFLTTYSNVYNRDLDSIYIAGCKNTGWLIDESTLDPTIVYIKTYSNNGAKTLRTSRASSSVISDNMLNDYFRNKLCLFRMTPEIIETNITSKLTMPTYDDITYVYTETENGINPTLRVTVDRLPQIAKSAVEDAEINSTSNNISLARMYINLLPESSYKDQLHNQLSDVFSSDITLDKKNATANLDIYIKSENMLSLSLNTNSVTFEDYSGVEDMEKLNAVNITINSSLPYSLNAYLSNEISNADKSQIMPIDILHIKENSVRDYQTFANNTDKIVLKDNCIKGNNNIHNIDLKLASNKAHKSDIYKTVIKFEAEQK